MDEDADLPWVYAASRASVRARPEMWKRLRDRCGWRITSTWIDEAGEGETQSFSELWERIGLEIARAEGLILYAEASDLPLKGALVECGMALGMGKRVAVVLPGMEIEPNSMRPMGSWMAHPLVRIRNGLWGAWLWAATGVETAA
jgi:hypothetical protein